MAAIKIDYARVSTEEQDLTAQRNALASLGVTAERRYVDQGLSGTTRAGPGLREALAACREGDTLVVTKLDRLARSLPDARDILDDLTHREVKLSLGGSVHDPTDPVGRLLFNVLAMIAEFEADLIRLRTCEGMKVAKAKGRLRGKQPKLNPRQEAHLIVLHRTGEHSTPSSPTCSASRARPSTARSTATSAGGQTGPRKRPYRGPFPVTTSGRAYRESVPVIAAARQRAWPRRRSGFVKRAHCWRGTAGEWTRRGELRFREGHSACGLRWSLVDFETRCAMQAKPDADRDADHRGGDVDLDVRDVGDEQRSNRLGGRLGAEQRQRQRS